MKPAIQSLWIILTVMVPGIVSYGTFRILVAVLGIQIPFLDAVDKSEGLSISVVMAIMFTLQFFGITIETIAFKIGPYRHDNAEYQKAFAKRYEIIATMDPEKDYHVERILGQFYMSHNIAVGMVLNFLWVLSYEYLLLRRFDTVSLVTGDILAVITILVLYVPYNRFSQSCQALHAHLGKLQQPVPFPQAERANLAP
jgi:hypothetical protein